MELTDAITGRRAIRDYTPAPVDEATIRRLIAAAALAPSAVNEQPWVFTVVRNRGLLDQMSVAAKAHMRTRPPAGASPQPSRSMLDDATFHIFYHAPVLIVVSAASPSPWIVEDCTLAAENLMLAAYAAGLGSCWIGLAQSYCNTEEGKAALGLAATATAVAPIIVGHPNAPSPATPRHPPEIRWLD